MVEKKKRNFALRDAMGNEIGVFTGKQPRPQNFTQVPFFIGGGLKPVHAMDASWNHTAQIPQSDANGLIHGWDAETYDAIGPELDYF